MTILSPRERVRERGRKFAFTLAEVLITLGIIGVVAALTLSSLLENYRERQTVIRLKQTYSIFSQAYLKMIEENGTLDSWADDSQEFLKQEFLKHLTVVKSCNNEYWCFVNSSGFNHGGGVGMYSYTLNNGVVLGIGSRTPNVGEWSHCYYKLSEQKGDISYGRCGSIVVDINGKRGPNKNGHDIFFFKLYADGILPSGSPIHRNDSWIGDFNRTGSCIGQYGETCAGWVIYNGNMDYLHCPEKLGWGKATSCKD